MLVKEEFKAGKEGAAWLTRELVNWEEDLRRVLADQWSAKEGPILWLDEEDNRASNVEAHYNYMVPARLNNQAYKGYPSNYVDGELNYACSKAQISILCHRDEDSLLVRYRGPARHHWREACQRLGSAEGLCRMVDNEFWGDGQDVYLSEFHPGHISDPYGEIEWEGKVIRHNAARLNDGECYARIGHGTITHDVQDEYDASELEVHTGTFILMFQHCVSSNRPDTLKGYIELPESTYVWTRADSLREAEEGLLDMALSASGQLQREALERCLNDTEQCSKL